jgi:DNA-binding response OmpR family regulator
MRILVLDDYRPHGESLRDLISSQGYEALYAETYACARAFLARIRFDLAFLDYDLRDMKGTQVATLLREEFPDMSAVIVSASASTARREAAARDLPFLEKPVSPRRVAEFLMELERRQRGTSLVLRKALPIVRIRDLRKGLPDPGPPEQP